MQKSLLMVIWPLGMHLMGVINAADVLIATQLVLGQRTAGSLQYAHGDMNQDEVIDLADLLHIQQAVLQ